MVSTVYEKFRGSALLGGREKEITGKFGFGSQRKSYDIDKKRLPDIFVRPYKDSGRSDLLSKWRTSALLLDSKLLLQVLRLPIHIVGFIDSLTDVTFSAQLLQDVPGDNHW